MDTENTNLPKNESATDTTPKPAPAVRHTNQEFYQRTKTLSIIFLLMVSMVFGFLGGRLGNNPNSFGNNSPLVVSNVGQVINNIAKNVGQSVVSVNVTGQAAPATDITGLFGFGGGSSGVQQSAGTGIILTTSGLIITNRHVVPAGTTEVSVTLSDGTTYDNVDVVGRTASNNSLDIAFLKIRDTKGKALVPAHLGDSSKVQVGDQVVAIGNALGQFQNTVTSGIISGHGRSIQATDSTGTTGENLADLFQTDAAINEGNSGGPLVNLSGQVIGINTAVAGNAQNIGFSIPINEVKGIVKNVESNGKLQQPYLGVIYVPITSSVAVQYNLSVNSGAYIPPASVSGQASIIPGGPAAKAGLQEGDIITKIDGTNVDKNNSLTELLGQKSVGDSINITVIRGGKQINVTATLAQAPTS